MSGYSGKVVCFGGGTGLSNFLGGIKKYANPTAIVTMADDGGSTGELRDKYGVLPTGDIRRCLCALSADNPNLYQTGNNLLRDVFEHRFERRRGEESLYGKTVDDLLLMALTDIAGEYGIGPKKSKQWAEEKRENLFNPEAHGSVVVRRLRSYKFSREGAVGNHSMGNLLLTALDKETGSYVEAVRIASSVLHVKGRVLPVTIKDTRLVAGLDNGEVIFGETHIDIPEHDKSRRIEKIYLNPAADVYYEAEQSIEDADFIVVGPGDLYSSILPNMIVDGVTEAIKRARLKGAKVTYVCNLMTEPGETNGFTAGDHLEKVINHVGEGIVDVVVCNNSFEKGDMPADILKRYELDGRFPVEIDRIRMKRFGVRLEVNNFTEGGNGNMKFIRHDSQKLAKHVISLARK